MKKEIPTLQEHIKYANELLQVQNKLAATLTKMMSRYPINHKITKTINKLHPSVPGNHFAQLKSLLDSEYHRVATQEEFEKHGHIYYKNNS